MRSMTLTILLPGAFLRGEADQTVAETLARGLLPGEWGEVQRLRTEADRLGAEQDAPEHLSEPQQPSPEAQ
jgi:hypothetical protein